MRIASPYQLRARSHWTAVSALRTCLRARSCIQSLPLNAVAFHSYHNPFRDRNSARRPPHAERNKSTQSGRYAEQKTRNSKEDVVDQGWRKIQSNQLAADVARLSKEERHNPDVWARLIEQHRNNSSHADGTKGQGAGASLSDTSRTYILDLLELARRPGDADTDILAHMLVGSRKQSAIWLCINLLRNLAERRSARSAELPPSNIIWPKDTLEKLTRRSIKLSPSSLSHFSPESSDNWENHNMDPRYSTYMSTGKDVTMDHIWTTLGTVVVRSADMGVEEAQSALNAVRLILGEIHKLDLVPDHVYSYRPSTASATVQRPPIIHLLSSRILTALSDAAWRDQQNENIEKAASHGLSYEQIGRDPPGGRFRLKVRPLDPEMWLEFILWCCVEGGYMRAGRRIVSLLQRNTDNPWFAVTWSGSSNTGSAMAHIDWERVRSRTGGTVGRLEGYSKVKPLAEVPSRTISTEVVLALVEGHIDAIQRTENANGMRLEAAQRVVVQLLSFLEPHDLPVSYFDYVSSRLFMTDAFDVDRSKLFSQWSDKLSLLKALKPVQHQPSPQASFQLNDILNHSEFLAGVLHQVLDTFVQDGNIHSALKTFNDIQKFVDNSKLHAISSFLQNDPTPNEGFFSSRISGVNSDFVASHGQLPLYKLAGILNLATDTNLIGFGQWLVYSQDPDGPLIRKSAYTASGIARALLRFAALSNDYQLLNSISSGSQTLALPSVRFMRTSLDARLSVLDLVGARRLARSLKRAEGGGPSLINLANLAGVILKLEYNVFFTPVLGVITPQSGKEVLLDNARKLFDGMLSGRYDGRSGVYQQSVKRIFKQQISHLLTIFESFPDSSISSIAREHRHRYRVSNIPNLSPSVFNIFLEAVTEAKGPSEGIDLIENFCILPGELKSKNASQIFPGDYVVENEDDAEADAELESQWSEPSNSTAGSAQTSERLVSNVNSADELGSIATSTSTSGAQGFIPFVREQIVREEAKDRDVEVGASSQLQEEDEKAEPEDELGSKPAGPITLGSDVSNIFTSPFFPGEQTPMQPNTQPQKDEQSAIDADRNHFLPVCTYDVRTIRLIVRSASQQKQEDTDRKFMRRSPVLEWAREKFAELGCTPTMISNEIRVQPAETRMVGDVRTKKSSTRAKSNAKKARISRITRNFGSPADSSRTAFRGVRRDHTDGLEQT